MFDDGNKKKVGHTNCDDVRENVKEKYQANINHTVGDRGRMLLEKKITNH